MGEDGGPGVRGGGGAGGGGGGGGRGRGGFDEKWAGVRGEMGMGKKSEFWVGYPMKKNGAGVGKD